MQYQIAVLDPPGEISMANDPTIMATTQCVGFARNWIETHLGMTFSQVKIAADIWERISHYRCISGSTTHHVINRENGGKHPPQIGDLIIYHQNLFGTGHVAVVTDIKDNNRTIMVAEQNYLNRYQSPMQRRAIALSQRGESCWLQDRFIIGWKQINADGHTHNSTQHQR